MFFVVAAPAAPLSPTAVRCWCATPLTPPLSLGARCALRERTGLTHAAPPALDSGRGWCSVASGCIFERDTQTRGKCHIRLTNFGFRSAAKKQIPASRDKYHSLRLLSSQPRAAVPHNPVRHEMCLGSREAAAEPILRLSLGDGM